MARRHNNSKYIGPKSQHPQVHKTNTSEHKRTGLDSIILGDQNTHSH
jgi:hypothetical protein